MNDIFFNEKGFLRSGWRVAFFFFAFVFFVLLITPIANYLLQILPIDFESDSLVARIYESIIGLFLAIFLGWLCGKLFENLPFRALGTWFTKYWLKDLSIGLLVGILSISIAVLLAMAVGGLRFQYNEAAGISAIQTTLLVSFIVFLLGAAFEEVFIRGYIFQTFVRANLTWLAILTTSIVFALGHIWNPNSEIFSSINTFLAGVWLAVAYLKTRTLWLAFGIHLSWNWFQGSILGIEVSGLTNLATAPVLQEIDSGPTWITGGDYGIEGGIACSIALIISTIVIWYIPFLKPTEEMLELTSNEVNLKDFPEQV